MSHPPARFRDLLAAEWTKLWSLRSTYATLALVALAVIGASADSARWDYANWWRFPAAQRAAFYPVKDAFVNNTYLFLMLAAGTVGAVAVVSEYSSGLIRTTFAAVPARGAVVAAKVAVVAAVMSAAGALTATVSFAVSQAILSGRHAGWSFAHPGVPRAVAASALLMPVCALVGMGLGALVRHSATTVVTTAVVLLLLPSFFTGDRRWEIDVHNAMPMTAWHRLTDLSGWLADAPWQATVAGSWVVFAAWPLAAVTLAVVVVRGRDV